MEVAGREKLVNDDGRGATSHSHRYSHSRVQHELHIRQGVFQRDHPVPPVPTVMFMFDRKQSRQGMPRRRAGTHKDLRGVPLVSLFRAFAWIIEYNEEPPAVFPLYFAR